MVEFFFFRVSVQSRFVFSSIQWKLFAVIHIFNFAFCSEVLKIRIERLTTNSMQFLIQNYKIYIFRASLPKIT